MLKKGKLLPLIFSGVTAAAVSLATVSCSFEQNPLTIEGPSEFMVETGGSIDAEKPYEVQFYEARVIEDVTLTIEPVNHVGDDIWNKITIDEKGYLKSEAFIDVEPCTLTFKVHAEYKNPKENKNYECDSDVVSLAIVEPSSKKITVEGGSPSIEVKKPFVDYIDGSPWELKVDDDAVDATFELDGGSDPEVGEGQHIDIKKDTIGNKWYVHVDGDTTPGTHSFKVTGTGTEGNADITASANVTVVVNDADVYKVMGGSTTLNGTSGIAGADTGNVWALYKNGTKQDMTGASYLLTGEDEQLGEDININNGVVSWSSSVSAGIYKEHKFDVQITTATGEVYSTGTSGAVTLTIADVYELTPAKGVEQGKFGEPGKSLGYFTLKVDGDNEPLSLSEGYRLSFSQTPTVNVSLVDTGDGIQLQWNQPGSLLPNVPVGDNQFTFNVTYSGTVVATCTVHLIISDADVYTVLGGSTTLNGTSGIADADTGNVWALYKNGVKQDMTSASYELTGDDEDVFEGDITIISGVVSWNGSVNAEEHKFGVKITVGGEVYATADDAVTLTIEEPEPEPIIIEGTSVVKATDPNAVFKAYNFPKAEDADPIEGLHWTVEGWTGDTAYRPTMVTTEDEEGDEVVRLSSVANAVGTATIQATDEASNVVATFKTTVQDPTLDSNEVWTVIVDDFGSRWATLSMDDLTSTSESIHYKFIGTTSGDDGSIGRGVFNQEIKIGNYVDYIPDNFLNNCAAFGTNGTGKVTFVDEEDNPASCTRIGEYFMENCQNFNSVLTLPSTIKRIDDGFLADCIKFNNGETTAKSEWYMPSSLTHIGDEFLYNCSAFTQHLFIRSSVEYIGFEFMQNCINMTGTITLDCHVSAFQTATGCLSFATLSDTAPAWWDRGITVLVNSGAEADQLAAKFPTITGTEGTSSNWRKLNIAH